MRFPVLSLALLTLSTACLLAADALPQVEVDATAPGVAIPEHFTGLSFETADILARPDGSRLFSPDNKPLVALFHTLGLHSLRIGGNTADRPSVPMPSEADIDSLFAFAKAVDAKVIYTLRLRQSDAGVAIPMARYIWAHYRDRLDQFAIGNEPNIYAKTFEEYLKILNSYKAAVLAPDVAPGAAFCGPSTTPNKAEWAKELAEQVGRKGDVTLLTQHEYVGGAGNKVTDPAAAREKLLSDSLHGNYAKIRDALAPSAMAAGVPWRIEETNSFYNGGAQHVSNSLASALWALDYLHWFALNGCNGINFHTGDYVAAGEKQTRCWYATFWNSPDGLVLHPIAYALLAFNQGAQGVEVPVSVSPSVAHLSAYATRASDGRVLVTLINRGHTEVTLSLDVKGAAGDVKPGRVNLSTPDSNPANENDTSLGGVAISARGTWDGPAWQHIPAGAPVTVPAESAAILSYPAKR